MGGVGRGANTVSGTGSTVGELQGLGWNNNEIGQMGDIEPSTGNRILGGVGSALQGGLRGMQQPQQQGGGGAQISVAPQAQLGAQAYGAVQNPIMPYGMNPYFFGQ